jgi:hypothetical protein
VTHIKESTLRQIQAFLAAGGHVIADTLLPVGLLEVQGTGQVGRLDELFGRFGTSCSSGIGSRNRTAFFSFLSS